MNGRMYHIDLTTTANCNFNCTYCFEHNYFQHKQFTEYDLLTKKVDELLNSEFFKNNYELLNIGFWGGEPTLNKECITTIIDYYKDNSKVKFFIYSNGSLIKEYFDLLKEYSKVTVGGNHPKVCTQISYDGQPLQDMYRKDKQGNLTGKKIKDAIRLLWKNKIPSVIKSVITPESFKHLKAAREDILSLFREFPQGDFFRSQGYFPTIEYYNIEKYTVEELTEYIQDLEDSMVDIAKDEIEFYRTNNMFFLKWLNPGKALCSAGRDMVCIDWNGNVFKCHGSLYDNKTGEHYITTLTDNEFVNKLEESHKLHAFNFGFEPQECKDCEATFCLRCNPVKFVRSEKTNYLDKWRDYTTQPELCKVYKKLGKITKAINQII